MLESIGGAGTLTLAGCIGSDGSSTETSSDGDSVTFALSTAENGRYSPIGDHERNGFELAIKHLNEGGGFVDVSEYGALSGDGVLDTTIEAEVLDSGSSASTTETNLQPRLENDELAMFTGGIAGNVAKTHRDLADEYETPYFVGSSTLNELTGSNCSPHVYRQLFDSTTLARALVSEIAADVEGNQRTFHIFADAPEGKDLSQSIDDVIGDSDLSWRPTGGIPVLPGTTSFESAVNEEVLSDITIVFLDLFGLDAVNAIQWARNALPDDTVIAVPYLTQSIVDSLGDRVDGIYGTVGWHEDLDTPLSYEFSKTYQREYGKIGSEALVPPGPAQTIYGQVIIYALATERAGSFKATAVRDELEGMEYALGVGGEVLRACDHQSVRSVPIVRGQSETDEFGNYFELRGGKRDLEPGCDEKPTGSCDL
jgi:ABC-type branched-subunit amino acid transport system substrate-binding protein